MLESCDVLDKEYLLLAKPCKVIRNENSAIVKDFDAHVLFGTADGFFITDASDDRINDEIEIDGDTAGFAYKNTSLGFVNVFYEHVDVTSYERIKLMPESEISDGDAELYSDGKRTKIILSVEKDETVKVTGDGGVQRRC